MLLTEQRNERRAMGFFSRTAFNRLTWVLRYKDAMARTSNLPVLRRLGGRILDFSTTNLSYIPIYEDIELPPGTVAPAGIIEHFINEASHHVIISRCPCRSEMGCKEFDPSFGCTFLGRGATQIDPAIGRHVTREESLQHLREASDMGLVSVIGKFKGDALALGVRDHSRLMTVCHCCSCCCVSTSLHLASREARDIMTKLEGLSVSVGEECTGCGKCVEVCIFKQISVENKRAVIGDECKGCGRCAMVCKAGAVKIRVEDSSYIDECIARISLKVDVT